MSSRRSLILSVVAGVVLVVALAAGYVQRELAEAEPFADRAVRALRSDDVRSAIAEQVAVELVERGSPDLVASRPVVLTAVEAVLETDEFEPVLRRAAVTAHAALLQGDRDAVIELEDAGAVLLPALERASPGIARQIPTDLSPRVAEIRRSAAASWVVRGADGASALALPLLVLALAGFGAAVVLAADRRRALAGAGVVLALAGAIGLVAMSALREEALPRAASLGSLSEDQARAAAGAAWDALAGGLERWYAICAVAGLAVTGGALLAQARLDRAAALRFGAEIVAGGRLSRPARGLRGAALAILGALVLLRSEPVFAAAVVLVGGLLVILGLAEAVAATGGAGQERIRTGQRRRAVPAAALVAVALASGAAVLLVGGDEGAEPPASDEIVACNGLAALCDRRLDEVVLAGTHNSMSAADRPGWFFANQTRPIVRQLRDGIRLLMLDPHYGVVDSQGRVRTDLAAEGSSRNRVARELGPEAVGAAERLAGGLGLVPAEGERKLFLCHSLCELGAERMSSTLDDVRGFLERNRSEVVVVYIESSVEPDEVEREFENADLKPYLASLRRGEPLPLLREMVASGRRLVVLDEDDGGDAPWYHPGFVFLRDTRIDSLLTSRVNCETGRGTPESPLLVMNHWIDRFPPSPSANGRVGGAETILRRARACRARHGRLPNAVVVDFYDRSGVIEAARRLNAAPR